MKSGLLRQFFRFFLPVALLVLASAGFYGQAEFQRELTGIGIEPGVADKLGLKSEVQHLPGGNVLRWERTTNT